MIRLEARTFNDAGDKVIRYQAVEAEDKEMVIDHFVTKFSGNHEPRALKQLLGLHNEIQLGSQLFAFYDCDGKVITVDA